MDLPMKQPGDSSPKHTSVGLASTLATGSTSAGWHPANGVKRNCFRELPLARGVLCLPLHTPIIHEILARIGLGVSMQQLDGDVNTGHTRPQVTFIKGLARF